MRCFGGLRTRGCHLQARGESGWDKCNLLQPCLSALGRGRQLVWRTRFWFSLPIKPSEQPTHRGLKQRYCAPSQPYPYLASPIDPELLLAGCHLCLSLMMQVWYRCSCDLYRCGDKPFQSRHAGRGCWGGVGFCRPWRRLGAHNLSATHAGGPAAQQWFDNIVAATFGAPLCGKKRCTDRGFTGGVGTVSVAALYPPVCKCSTVATPPSHPPAVPLQMATVHSLPRVSGRLHMSDTSKVRPRWLGGWRLLLLHLSAALKTTLRPLACDPCRPAPPDGSDAGAPGRKSHRRGAQP